MNRISLVSATALLLLAGTSGLAASKSEGTVRSILKDKIVIDGKSGPESYGVKGSPEITLNGGPVDLKILKSGDAVVVEFEPAQAKGLQGKAVSIAASRKKVKLLDDAPLPETRLVCLNKKDQCCVSAASPNSSGKDCFEQSEK